MKQAIKIFIFILILLLAVKSFADDELISKDQEVTSEASVTNELEGISVIGNRELPKALVIVPWKAPEPGDLDGSPLQSLIDEVLGPVDKDVHKRKVSYYEQYY